MLFKTFLESNTLTDKTITQAHYWLTDHLKTAEYFRTIRATGKFDFPPKNAREFRGRRISLSHSGLKAVFSDNELAVWLYQNLTNGKLFDRPFQTQLVERHIPVADSRAKNEADGSFLLQSVARHWGSEKNHKHIFDAGIYRTKNASEADGEEIDSRFLRLTHPINHFLFPSNLPYDAEQNSRPEFQYVAAFYMKSRLPRVFEEFVRFIKPGILFDWNNDWEKIGKALIDSLQFDLVDANRSELIQPVTPQSQIDLASNQLDSLSTTPSFKTMGGERVIAYQSTRLKFSLSAYQLWQREPSNAIVIAIKPGTNSAYQAGYYHFPPPAVKELLVPKTELPTWARHSEWVSPKPPSVFSAYFFPFSQSKNAA